MFVLILNKNTIWMQKVLIVLKIGIHFLEAQYNTFDFRVKYNPDMLLTDPTNTQYLIFM